MRRRTRVRQLAAAVVEVSSALAVAAPASASAATRATAVNVADTAWAASQLPLPAGRAANPTPTLPAESCATDGFCAAAGYYADADGHVQPLLETSDDTGWVARVAPLPAAAGSTSTGQLTAVDCPRQAFCVAVGSYTTATGASHAVLETYSFGRWTVEAAPMPAHAGKGNNTGGWLTSVDCQNSGSCVAVGRYEDAHGGQLGLIETLSGMTWTGQAAPQPPDAATEQSVQLSQVSCPAVGGCAAVGSYETATGGVQAEGLASLPGGATWSASAVPLPSDAQVGAGEDATLQTVSCQGGFCEGAGHFYDSVGHERGLLARVTAGNWTGSEAPEPGNAGVDVHQGADVVDVSCTFDGCVAVGSYTDLAGGLRPLTVAVPTQGVPLPAEAPQPADQTAGNAVDGRLNAVSCLSLSSCVAVGAYVNTTGSTNYLGLIDRLSARGWSTSRTPVPSTAVGDGAHSGLAAVSCPPGGGCRAAGYFYDAPHDVEGLFVRSSPTQGYWEDAGDGGIFAFGNAGYSGAVGAHAAAIVAMASTPGGGGYWEAAADGGVFAFGDAHFLGSAEGAHLAAPIVGMAAAADGNGYWLVGADGGVYSFGDARFFGSTGGFRRNAAIVGMAASPDGAGYWLVASDGGVFAFGDARFWGSTGGLHLNKPIVAMAASPDGAGYWLVASDGGVFSFGDARYDGSTGGTTWPIVSVLATPDGGGYWLVALDGGVFAFGDARFLGSTGGMPLQARMVGGAPA
jgi:hypothetical protein